MAAGSTASFPGQPSGGTRRERLAQRRRALGLTQEDLAAKLEVERTTVVRWERGETEPLPSVRPRLARVLRVSAGQLAELLDADAAPVPRQLPPAVTDFTGRAAELTALTVALSAAGSVPGTVVISAIGGTAGVGKSALALHWAHRVADQFPDGQLHVNLRGFDPSGTPATAAEAIRGFLDALGVKPGRIPPTPDAQAGLYRSLLADRRMLIVLDNARDEQQVRPLLPASPGSFVIVTSRSELTGLASADGARLISLDVLTEADAAALLTARLGESRAAAEPAAVAEIAALCACLPLALSVTAARAGARPRLPLAALATELRDAAGRLDALDTGDPAVSVRAVFSWSYARLSDEQARMFRLLGLHPGPDITVPAAASLAAVDQPAARGLLRNLSRVHLIAEHAPGRYTFHDLLRAYAAEQAAAHDSETDRSAAAGRLLDHYLHTADRACWLLHPSREPVALSPSRPGVEPESLADPQQAMAWFEAEQQVLLEAIRLAVSSRFDEHAWKLPLAIEHFLALRELDRPLSDILPAALAAATRLADVAGQAVLSRSVAFRYADLGDQEQALAQMTNSLALSRLLGDRLGEAKAHQGLAFITEAQGRYADSLDHVEQALRLYQVAGNKVGEAETLNGAGWLHALLGDFGRARTLCRQALAISAEHDRSNPFYTGTGYIWDSLGYIERQLGDTGEATACYERALAIFRNAGSRSEAAEVLSKLGEIWQDTGELPRARQAWQQALAILEDLDLPQAGDVRARLAGL